MPQLCGLFLLLNIYVCVTPVRRWGVTTTDAPAVMAAHQLTQSAVRSSRYSDWPVHNMMLFVFDSLITSTRTMITVIALR